MGASVALALSSGAYGLLVGPLLRLAFGGEDPAWPLALRAHLPPPPSAAELRAWLPVCVAASALVKGGAQLAQRVSLTALSAGFGRATRAQLARDLLCAPLDQREAAGEAHLHSLLTRHIERLERWVEEGVAPLWRDGAQVLTLAVTACVVSGEIGLIVLALYPLLFTPIALVRSRLRRAAREELSSASALSRWALSHLRAASWLKAHGLMGEARAPEEAQHEALWESQRRLAWLQGLAPSFTEVAGALVVAGSLGFFLEGVAEGRWRAEELMSLFVCLVLMYQPLKGLTRAVGLWAGARAAWDDLAVWLERGAGSPEAPAPCEPAYAPYLRLWDWRVERGGQPIATLTSAEVRAGRITRLRGPNGAGKTSLLCQLIGLNPPPTGGGLSLQRSSAHPTAPSTSLEGRCAWLGQGGGDPLALLSLSGAELHESLKRLSATSAQAWPLSPTTIFEALTLPREWLTGDERPRLDELSGGERRKLSLALTLCALSPTRPLLLLDEPETHLDAASIEGLCDLLARLESSERCAILLITHDPRLAALARAEVRLDRCER